MKDKYVQLGFMSLFISIIPFLTNEVLSEEFLVYENNDVSIEYPANWIKLEMPIQGNITDDISLNDIFQTNITDDISLNDVMSTIVVGFYNENFTADLNISMENVSFGTSLEEYVAANLRFLPLLPEFKLISSVPTTIANLPAMKLVSTYNSIDPTVPSSESQYQQVQIYTLHEGKGHVISFSTLPDLIDSYQPIMERVFNSYKLK